MIMQHNITVKPAGHTDCGRTVLIVGGTVLDV